MLLWTSIYVRAPSFELCTIDLCMTQIIIPEKFHSAIKFEFITEIFFILDCKLPIDSIAVRNLWAIWCQSFFASSSCLSFLAPISPHASGYLLPVARQPHPYAQKML